MWNLELVSFITIFCGGAGLLNISSLPELTQKAYKKLKASVYFDKTLLPLRDSIVAYEDENVDQQLCRISKLLRGESDEEWHRYAKPIIENIDVLAYPKKLKEIEASVIFNCNAAMPELDRAVYFIDLPVEGHILGIMWVCAVGCLIDNRQKDEEGPLYEHLYGNRLRKFLVNPETKDVTFSPYLFEPYFSQYESWRDKALKLAQRHLDDEQDVLILTLDFKDFFYSLDMTPDVFKKLATTLKLEKGSWQYRLHWFVHKVMSRYSDILRHPPKSQFRLEIGFKGAYSFAYRFFTVEHFE